MGNLCKRRAQGAVRCVERKITCFQCLKPWLVAPCNLLLTFLMKTASWKLICIAVCSRAFFKGVHLCLWAIITIDVCSHQPIKNYENNIVLFIANDLTCLCPWFSWHENNSTTATTSTELHSPCNIITKNICQHHFIKILNNNNAKAMSSKKQVVLTTNQSYRSEHYHYYGEE